MPVTVIRDSSHLTSELAEAGEKLSVLDFTATWCGPCKFIAPKFERLSGKYSTTKFLKVDVDECSDVAQDYNVRSMPTFVFVKNSKEVARFSGASVTNLETTIQQHASSDAFTGTGHTLNSESNTTASSASSQGGIGTWLGNLVGSVVSGSDTPSGTSISNSDEMNQKFEEQAREIFPVDKTQPTCKMQVRLSDGSKMIVTMNNNETVSQLRQYITVARPSYAETEFVLLAGHPSKVIEDESVTLEAAYLSNAVVVAQIKK